MYVVIAGGGKIGQYLTSSLISEGNQVAIIEQDEDSARQLSELFGSALVICGDGCEVSSQEDAGVHQADIFVATTGHDENNLAACEIAKSIYEVPRCIARVNTPKNQRIFRRLGIESVSSTALIARVIEEEATLSSMSVALSLTSDQISLIDMKVPRFRRHDNEAGIRALDLEQELEEGIRLVAVSHDDTIEVVGEETTILPGDQVILAVDTEMLETAREIVRSL